MEKCDKCKKKFTTKHRHENVVYLSTIQYFFCDKHYREVCREIRIATILFPHKIRHAKPNTREWGLLCRRQEKTVEKYMKLDETLKR